ncbi:MAG: sugar ABC transporter substrate-binding protein [Thermomicrobiales bacterium]|nr:sugar ABC transporter substrate-binding protein [Thermomicrobiales bacterium]
MDALKLKRRSVLATIPAVGAATLARPARASEPTTVRFAYFGDETEQLAYAHLIERFEAAFPAITIKAMPIASRNIPPEGRPLPSGGYPEWLRQAFVTGTPPDVFMLGYRDLGRYVSKNVVEPLGSYVNGSSVFGQSDFYAAALDAFRNPFLGADDLGAIPQNASSLVVYYNVDMFDTMGIDRPAAGWTWDEFAAAAQALTLDLNGDGRIDIHGVAFEPTITRYAAFIWGAGGELYDDVFAPTKLLIDSAEAMKGIRWLTQLGKAGLNVTPTQEEARLLDDTRRFRSGHAAMLIQSRRVTTFLRQNSAVSWDVAPLPVGDVPVNVLHSDGLAMYSGSKSKDAAWTFIEFAMGPIGQAILAESGRTVPSLRDVAESDAFLKGTSMADRLGFGLRPGNARVFLDNIDLSRRLPSEVSWPSVVREVDTELKHAFFVDGDVETAVTRILERSKPAFESVDSLYRRLYQMSLPAPETED